MADRHVDLIEFAKRKKPKIDQTVKLAVDGYRIVKFEVGKNINAVKKIIKNFHPSVRSYEIRGFHYLDDRLNSDCPPVSFEVEIEYVAVDSFKKKLKRIGEVKFL